MQNHRDVIVGVFDDRSRAEQAVEALHQAGFGDNQIGFAAREVQGEGSGSGAEGTPPSKGGQGLAKGAVVGGILGAAAALLIPGIGPVIAGGILAPLLGGATAAGVGAAGAAAGAAIGGLAGGLSGLGVPETEAKYYEGEFESGRTIVTVRPGDRYAEAESILQQYGAYDATHQHASTLTETATTAMPTSTATVSEQAQSMPLREERLSVGKTREAVGEARLSKDVVEQNLDVDVPVTREEVYDRERPANAPATGPVGQSESISVPVNEEQVDVAKNTQVYGEVEIGKRKVEETRRVRDTVRKEVPKLEKTGDAEVEVEDQLPADDPRLKKAS